MNEIDVKDAIEADNMAGTLERKEANIKAILNTLITAT